MILMTINKLLKTSDDIYKSDIKKWKFEVKRRKTLIINIFALSFKIHNDYTHCVRL